MKFKIIKGTALFEKFVAVHNDMTRCRNKAIKLMKDVKAKHIRKKVGVAEGGISAFGFDNKPDDNWAYAYSGKHNTGEDFMPIKNRKANSGLLSLINHLPVVEYEQINSIIGFNYTDTESFRLNFLPGIAWADNYVLIEIGSQYTNYTPVDDMIEITESEYRKLYNEIPGKKKR